MEMQKFRFGSYDSVDIDNIYVFSEIPTIQDCKKFCDGKNDSRNIIVVENGVVRECYKGHPDEVNNALYYTYSLHPQNLENPIEKPVKRIVPLKVARAIRVILSHLSRGEKRQEILSALKSNNFDLRRKTLEDLDLSSETISPDALKSIAFQLGQTISLIQGKEVYTKNDISDLFPALRLFLYRVPNSDTRILNEHRDQLIDITKKIFTRQRGDLNLLCYTKSPEIEDWNDFALQSRGIVLDLRRERCIHYPYDKFFRFGEEQAGLLEILLESSKPEIAEKIDGSMLSVFMHDGKIIFASKGGFENEVSEISRKIAIQNRIDLSNLDFQDYSYIFEVISPLLRFPKGMGIVDYDDKEEIYLIGIRSKLTNEPLPYSSVIEHAKLKGLAFPRIEKRDLREVLKTTQQNGELKEEGYVARFDNGKQVKIKYLAYDITSKSIHDLRKNRFVRKFIRLSNEEKKLILNSLPIDFRQIAENQLSRYNNIRSELESYIREEVEKAKKQSIDFHEYVEDYVDYHLAKTMQRYKRSEKVDEGSMQEAALYCYHNGGIPKKCQAI